jgi:hypothetical protein
MNYLRKRCKRREYVLVEFTRQSGSREATTHHALYRADDAHPSMLTDTRWIPIPADADGEDKKSPFWWEERP